MNGAVYIGIVTGITWYLGWKALWAWKNATPFILTEQDQIILSNTY